MFLPRTFTSSTSGLYRFPPHSSHGTWTSAMNTISTSSAPAPSQSSQRPPSTLKLNVPGRVFPLARERSVGEDRADLSNALMYVTGFERGDFPIGL